VTVTLTKNPLESHSTCENPLHFTHSICRRSLFELVVEVTAAIETLDEEGQIAREDSVNPARLDGDVLLTKAVDNAFKVQRYRNGLAGLQGLYNEVVANEQAAAWRAEADKVQAVRDQLSADVALRYPALVDEMVGLLTRMVDCDRRIDCLHAAAPESEGTHRLRKIEATARRIDIVQSGTGIIENCRLPNLLVGQHGSSQAWPPAPQQNVGLELLSIFPRNGSGDPNEDRFYEMVLDEVAGHYVMRRRPDAPPLAPPRAPPQLTMREQILSEQARRSQAAPLADERYRRNSN
jgi:hypothetical protein